MLAFTYVNLFSCQCLNDEVLLASAGLTARVSHGRLGSSESDASLTPNAFLTDKFDTLLDHLIAYLVLFFSGNWA